MSKIFWKSITRDIFIVAVGVALGVIGTIVSTKYMMPKLSVEVSWKSYIFGMENTSNKTNTDIPEKGYNWDLTKSKGEFLIFQDLENLPIEKVDPFVRILSQDESIRNFPPHICYIFKALIKNLGELTADEIELGIFVPSDAEAYISVCSNVRWKVLQDGKKGLKIIRIDRLVPKQVAVLTVYFNIYGFSLEVAEEFKKIFDLDVTTETTYKGRIRDELIDFAEVNINQKKESISEENTTYINEEINLLNKFTEEALLKFKQEIDHRENDIKEYNKRMRASRTMGAHEIQELQQEVEKKQKDLFKAQKNYFKNQEEQFKLKEYKVGSLRNKLQMNYTLKRVAEVVFKITK